jgi:hypothetical protein
VSERQDQAVEYLQTAAIEAIKAMRAVLDIAETLVREPETAATVAKAVADAAASMVRPSTLSEDDGDDAESETEHPTGCSPKPTCESWPRSRARTPR